MNVAVDEWFGPGLAPTVSIVGAVPVMLHHGLAGVGQPRRPGNTQVHRIMQSVGDGGHRTACAMRARIASGESSVSTCTVTRIVPNPAGSISPDDRSHSELRPTSTWTTRSRGRYAASNVSGRAGHRLKQAILSQGRAGTFANLRRYAGVLRKV